LDDLASLTPGRVIDLHSPYINGLFHKFVPENLSNPMTAAGSVS
jgi:hypothetical protein